jgi:hypothetical protein
MLHVHVLFWQWFQGHWKGEIAMTVRTTELTTYRTIQEMLFCDFLEFYQTCLDAIPPVPGLEISSPELVKEVGILIGRMDADNCRKAERIVAEFKKQFDILERVSHQHSMQKTLSTFVFELPGNLLTLLRKVYTLPDFEFDISKNTEKSEWLRGRYQVNVERAGEEPVLFLRGD